MYDLSEELTVILLSIWFFETFKERLAVSKRAARKFNVGGFNFRKLNKLEVGKEYQIKISNRFALWKN